MVKIEVATQVPDYRTPWNSGRFSGGTGTGFIIGPNQILTNAHVVSDNRRLLVTRRGSSRKHVARVRHIAHDCDLALIELQDFEPFEGLPYLDIGGMPTLESRVSAIGYPVGGERLSVTQGCGLTDRLQQLQSLARGLPSRHPNRCRDQSGKLGRPCRSGRQGCRRRFPGEYASGQCGVHHSYPGREAIPQGHFGR